MTQNIGTDMRMFFTRTGAARYISHLDVNRCMQRALARTHLPVWYTQGFNPHIYITFALPTPLGYESRCETMDFRIMEPISPEEMRDRMNACLPMGFRVERVAPPVHAPEDIKSADYAVEVSAPGVTARELRRRLDAFLEQDEILTDKKTKKGTKQIDLKPMMDLLALEERNEQSLLVKLRLAAGSQQNINPTLVFDAFAVASGTALDCIRVEKQQVYVEIGEQRKTFA